MGGEGGLVKKEKEEIDNGNYNNNEGNVISIAERRALKGGYKASCTINAPRPPFFTVPPGLSPSALLDSPVMLSNEQGLLSPTTGTFQLPSSRNDEERSKAAGEAGIQEASEVATRADQNKPFEEFDQYGRKMQVSRGGGGGNNENQKHEKIINSNSIEDGYLWRKYGQKHVKGSEYPRSYYKCTNPNCPVTKKVERCEEGQVSEIVYKGSHNHPEPLPTFKRNNEAVVATSVVPPTNYSTMDHHHTTSSFHVLASLPTSTTQESTTALDQDHSDQSISSEGHDADENGDLISHPRKRKREMSYPRCTREPKVVVQIESEIDILDDGYRWRKYGQKVVKGNPNPRSYYKCTSPGCGVRKHVERAGNDIKSVITTYEGKHNHQVPSSKGCLSSSSSVNVKGDDAGVVREEVERKRGGGMFGQRPSSLYPLSFPPFHTLPYPPSLLPPPSSSNNLYPLIVPHHNYPSFSLDDTTDINNMMMIIPKEEQRDHDDADHLYHTIHTPSS